MPYQYSTIVKKIDDVSNEVNRELIHEFLEYMKDNHSSENHQINNLKCVINLAGWLNKTTFCEIVDRDQIVSFLNTKVKNKEEDPEQKWVTTWNNYLNRIRLFYRWLHNKDKNLDNSYWETPKFIQIRSLKTKRISPYSENELWEKDELLTIIKYEPHARNKAALALMWDLNARNHEITLLKIKNLRIRERYAEGEIPHEAKTGGGPILLTLSFPFVRDWLNEHPFRNEPEAKLICDLNTGGMIRADALNDIMKLLRKRIVRLLESNEITDKKESEILRYIVDTKKFNPYCIRHSSICADSDWLPDFALKKKVRWSMNSRQGLRYIKSRMGNDLKEKILLQNGIITDSEMQKRASVLNCPRCSLVNAIEKKFCSKCSYPLVPSAFDEIKAVEDMKFRTIEERFNNIQSMLEKLIIGLSKTADQQQFNTITQSLLSSGVLRVALSPTTINTTSAE